MASLVKHVVVDSGGFIRNAPLHEIGANIYTLPEVVNEIRDKATKQRLQVLPYKLQFREPSAECVKAVSDFARKTGDYRSLSSVDIKVIALAYLLEKENAGTEHIRTEPVKQEVWTASKKSLEKPTDIAGFYIKQKTNQVTEDSIDDGKSNAVELVQSSPVSSEIVSNDTISPESQRNELHNEYEHTVNDEELQEEEEESEGESDDDSSDDGGWITPSNLKAARKAMGDQNTEKAEVTVGCITTDFAIQNVLIQMGLNVVSVDGMLIKKTKNFVLRCSACLKLTKNLEKEFCPHCGNHTLQKLTMTVNEDGSIQYFLSRRKPMTTRGLKYSLPMPKGGKHANNPILCEDQIIAQQRTTKFSKNNKLDVFSPDYVANSSPFSLNDVTSRAAQLGIRDHKGQKSRNPNESRKRRGRRK
ncbi:RNA-binding protein NOB1-like [Tubulanus polymorphus]|uniref:RNA-binding protein NOB1-like n=1 Tax=Tubulanus polymorphus TaxID=672921 RepID=UPI003DA69A74